MIIDNIMNKIQLNSIIFNCQIN